MDTRLFIISVFLDDGRSFRLGYHEEELANSTYNKLLELLRAAVCDPAGIFEVKDQFSTRASFIVKQLSQVVFVQPARELQLNGEIRLIEARANINLQDMARRDSKLGQRPIVVPGYSGPQ